MIMPNLSETRRKVTEEFSTPRKTLDRASRFEGFANCAYSSDKIGRSLCPLTIIRLS